MLLISLAITLAIEHCYCARLYPLENNDKLQDINNQYVAEWQWESWPVKQDSSEKDAKWPGPRINIALWKDSSGPNWYLFGGLPVNPDIKKIYSDVWKYSVKTRLWERFFPSTPEVKGTNFAKIGGLMTLRANLFNEGFKSTSEPQNYNVILCGGVTKTNSTKIKKQNFWNNFTRRKKQPEPERRELRSLVVYAPKTSTSNTVWQIDLKDKLWTAYVCCCDSSTNDEKLSIGSVIKPTENVTKIITEEAEKSQNTNEEKRNIGKDRSKMEENKENFETKSNEKVSVVKKSKKNDFVGPGKAEKRSVHWKVNNGNSSSALPIDRSSKNKVPTSKVKTNMTRTKKEKYDIKMKEAENKATNKATKVNAVENFQKIKEPKIASKYCPDFKEGIEPVTWCDGNNEVLITADITSPQITLWIFNLKTSHWSQKAVQVPEGIKWPGCSSSDTIRYAGNEEDVYVICSPAPKESAQFNRSFNESRKSDSDFSEVNFPLKKIIYKINYKKQSLESLGEIQLSSYFQSAEGIRVWRNDTKSHWQVVRIGENEIIFILAYLDSMDMWILLRNPKKNRFQFESIEKIWRGSALKWFNKYNGPLYNIQITTESGNTETLLIPNPRIVGVNEYWPRDRGRFIIRLFKNENFKNQSFENRTQEQNLTYQLLQSDYKTPTSDSQLHHNYSFKVLVFFGISLAMFTIFGFIMFLKRCVNCPPRIRTPSENQKSPLVIHYSVIPEDLFYPVA